MFLNGADNIHDQSPFFAPQKSHFKFQKCCVVFSSLRELFNIRNVLRFHSV